jgi:hypothetical protein
VLNHAGGRAGAAHPGQGSLGAVAQPPHGLRRPAQVVQPLVQVVLRVERVLHRVEAERPLDAARAAQELQLRVGRLPARHSERLGYEVEGVQRRDSQRLGALAVGIRALVIQGDVRLLEGVRALPLAPLVLAGLVQPLDLRQALTQSDDEGQFLGFQERLTWLIGGLRFWCHGADTSRCHDTALEWCHDTLQR